MTAADENPDSSLDKRARLAFDGMSLAVGSSFEAAVAPRFGSLLPAPKLRDWRPLLRGQGGADRLSRSFRFLLRALLCGGEEGGAAQRTGFSPGVEPGVKMGDPVSG